MLQVRLSEVKRINIKKKDPARTQASNLNGMWQGIKNSGKIDNATSEGCALDLPSDLKEDKEWSQF